MKKGELCEYGRGIGLENRDDLKKPELLAQVKDKVYADAHRQRRRAEGRWPVRSYGAAKESGVSSG
jgi:hypothetical protein